MDAPWNADLFFCSVAEKLVETAASAYERAVGEDETSAIENEDLGPAVNAGDYFHAVLPVV